MEKRKNIVCLLRGALLAEEMVGLKMNVHKRNLDKILEILPSMHSPTISYMVDKDWVDVDVVVREIQVRELIPKLIKAGATGIVEYTLRKVIP